MNTLALIMQRNEDKVIGNITVVKTTKVKIIRNPD